MTHSDSPTCIACGRAARARILRDVPGIDGGRYSIEICQCGLGRTLGGSAVEVNTSVYSDIEQRLRSYYGHANAHLEIRYRKFLERAGAYKESAGRNLLDVGANIGFFSNCARRNNYNPTACEINTECREFAHSAFRLAVAPDIENLAGNYDVITLLDVLEHVDDPVAFLHIAKSRLVPGGVILIQCPNFRSRAAQARKQQWGWLIPPDHRYHFTPQSLTRVSEMGGLCVREVTTASPIDDIRFVVGLPSIIRGALVKLTNTIRPGDLIAQSDGRGSLIQIIASG